MSRGRAGEGAVRLSVGALGLFAVTSMLWLACWALLPLGVGWQPVTIVSGSMAPAIRDGDVVVVGRAERELEPGDVIVFRDQGDELVTHRIAEVLDDGRYRTRGDANQYRDSVPVAHDEIVGVGRLLVPYAGLPRLWVSLAEHVRVAAWVLGTLAAAAAASSLLPPGGDARSARRTTAPAGADGPRPRVTGRRWVGGTVASRLARALPARRWVGGVGVLLALAGPLGLVTSAAAFTDQHVGTAKLATGEWRDPAVHTASADGTVRKLDLDGQQLWQVGERVVLHDDLSTFEGWEAVPADGATVEHSDAAAYSGTHSLLKTGDEPTGGQRKFYESLGNQWRLEAWIHRGGSEDVRVGLEDEVGDGYGFSVSDAGIIVGRRSGAVAVAGSSYVAVTSEPGTWYRTVLHRDGDLLTLRIYDVEGAELGEVSWTDGTLSTFDRVVIRGDGPYHVDDLTVWDLSDPIGAQHTVAVDRAGAVHAAGADQRVRTFDADGDPGTSFDGHTDEVDRVAVDADGHRYTASRDGTVRKLAADGQQLWSVELGAAAAAVAADGDGNVYVGTADGVTHKRDPAGAPVWAEPGHAGAIHGVAVDRYGDVHTAGADGVVTKRDRHGTLVWTFTGHTDVVRDLTVDRDGIVHTVSDDGTVRRVDAAGDEVWTSSGHAGAVHAVADDGRGNVFSGGEDGTVRRLDADGSQQWSVAAHADAVLGLDAGWGRYVIAGHRPRRAPATPSGLTATAVSYRVDLDWEEVAIGTGAAWFDTRYRPVGAGTWRDGPRAHASDVPVSKLAATTTYEFQVRAGNDLSSSGWSETVTATTPPASAVYSVSGDDTARRLTIDGVEDSSSVIGSPTDVDVGSDGHTYVVTADGTLHERDPDGDDVWTVDLASPAHAVTVDDDGHGYVGLEDGSVRKFSRTDGSLLWSYGTGAGPALSVAVDTDGNVYVGSGDGSIGKLAADGKPIWTSAVHGDAVVGLAVAPSGEVLTASADGSARALDRDGEPLWAATGHGGGASTVASGAEGAVFTGAGDGSLRRLDPDTGAVVWHETVHTAAVHRLAIDIEGEVVSGSADTSVRRTAALDGAPRWTFEGHTGEVRSVAADVGRYLAAGHLPRPVPELVTGITTVGTTTATSELAWDVPPAGGGASWFDVRYREVGDEPWIDAARAYAPRADLAGLRGGTTYEVQVRAANDRHAGDWATATTTTDPGPAPPTNFVASPGCPPVPITFVGSSTHRSPDKESLVVPPPSGRQAGDLLLATWGTRNDALSSADVPTGWTLLTDLYENSFWAGTAYRVASGDDADGFTITSSKARLAGGISAYRGVDITDPIDVWDVDSGGDPRPEMLAPSVTTSEPGALLVANFTTRDGGDHTVPTGMTRRWEAGTETGGDRVNTTSQDEILTAAGDSGVRSSTHSADRRAWAGFSVALRAEKTYEVQLTWDATPTETTESYLLERSVGGTADPLDPWTVPYPETTFTDTDVEEATPYGYRIRAYEDGFTSAPLDAEVPSRPPC